MLTYKRIETARCLALVASALAKACHYTLTLWRKLTRFLEYPELELSNNLADNSIRPVALGRKNWILRAAFGGAHKKECRQLRACQRPTVHGVTKTTYADTTFTQTAYDAAGRVSSTTDANGHSTSYDYDDAGRRTSITDALTHVEPVAS